MSLKSITEKISQFRQSPYLKWFKTIWVVFILISASLVLIFRFDTVNLTQMSWQQLLLMSFFLISSKLLLVEQTRLSTLTVSSGLSYPALFQINAISQLAKYVPGSIWQFTNKGHDYLQKDLTTSQVFRAILIENAWLVSASILTGIICYWMKWWIALAVVLVWAFLLIYSMKKYWLYLGVLQLSIWVLASLSFWVMDPTLPFTQSIGAFCISWAVGYLTIFAPGGVGTRELALLFLLQGFISQDTLLSLLVIHRFWWTMVELALGAVVVGYQFLSRSVDADLVS